MQRRSRILVSVLLVAVLVSWRWPRKMRPLHRPSSATEVASRPAHTEGPAGPAESEAGAATPVPGGPAGVQRLDPARRKQLGAEIAAAIARRATRSTGVLAEPPLIPLEQVGKPLQDGLRAAIPLLATCYEGTGSARASTAMARMTMVSDPELGTVIDTNAITQADGGPLATQLDACLRDTIDALELPPLGQAGKVELEYTFRFD